MCQSFSPLRRALALAPEYIVPAVIAVVLYARAVGNQFVYDDVQVVVAHPLLKSLSTLPEAMVSPWWYQERHLYRPLALLSLGIDSVLARGAPWLTHAGNVVLHGLITVLVGRLAARWLPAGAAFVAALLFAVHPIHAEAVATAVGRAELLCAVMLVGVMLLASSQHGVTPWRRIAMAALAAAALASKEGGAVAPALAFAAAWATPSQRGHVRQWVAAAACGVVPLLVARVLVLGTLGGDVPHPAFAVGDWTTSVALALSVLPRTLLALTVPAPAPIDVAPPLSVAMAPNPWLVAAGVGLAVVVCLSLVAHVRRPSPASLGVWIVAAMLAPTANILFPSGVVLSGRTLYAPSIGIALLAGAAAAVVVRLSVAMRSIAAIAALAWSVLAAGLSLRESVVWRDSDAVGRAMLARQPRSYRSHVYLAEIARLRGDAHAALAHYRTALDLFPRDGYQLYSAASTALVTGDTTAAARWLEHAIELAPGHWMARTRAVKLALARGDTVYASALLDRGLALSPDQRTWRAWRQIIGGAYP